MRIRKLDSIFKPSRIAVIGASAQSGSVGHLLLHNLISSGFRGVVYPVNPKYESVHGIQAYPSVAGLPKTPDLAIIATPAPTVPGMVRECGEAGIRGLIIASSGFREVGEQGRALEQQIREEARKFAGMRIVGPNSAGVIVPGLHLHASCAAAMPKRGHIAFVSQSGRLSAAVLDWALQEDIGFSYFISVGNMLDVDYADLIDYLGEDADTRALILYVETVTGARRFMSAARAFTRTKPIVAYKSGRFAESAQVAASHTGVMAGEDAVYEAAFRRAGIERVFEIDDIFDCAELLARQRPPKGSRLAVITNAGGPGVMATDTLLSYRGVLAKLGTDTLQSLDKLLPQAGSHANPVDVGGDASPERFARATQVVLEDPGVDAAVVILVPQALTDPSTTASAIGDLVKPLRKPVLATWMGGRTVQEGVRRLNQAGIPTYPVPEKAVRAFMHLVSYARNLETIYETPRNIPVSFKLDRSKLRELLKNLAAEGQQALPEDLSMSFLDAYEIPVTRTSAALSPDEAVSAARDIGFPVVLKVLAPQIIHKAEVGGVVLNLCCEAEVRGAYGRILETVQRQRPGLDVRGVTVQPMVNTHAGLEIILGAKKDPNFGTVIMVGMGGTAAEVYHDLALGLPPLNERLTHSMLQSLRSWPLLQGYRGRPAVNLDRLIEIIMRFSYLVADFPEIRELDVNPLLVTGEDVVALDSRVIIDPAMLHQHYRPYSHLAISPYPAEYLRRAMLRDGTAVTLRPIKPEDEPMWHEMLASASPESIRFRFRILFRHTTHDMGIRYCFIDYDREMAIVAELEAGGTRKLAGVGRLAADPEHYAAELAVFVADPWQGRGLGRLLTQYCLEIAKSWGVQRVVGETTPDNSRMIALFVKMGFETEHRPEEGVVWASKNMV